MPLRRADLTNTRRFDDGDSYLVLRVGGLTKGEADRMRDAQAALRIDAASVAGGDAGRAAMVEIDQRTAAANRLLFDILAVDWSLDGNPTGESYAALDQESGEWVDECIAKVLSERRERAEKNVRSSRKRSAPAS